MTLAIILLLLAANIITTCFILLLSSSSTKTSTPSSSSPATTTTSASPSSVCATTNSPDHNDIDVDANDDKTCKRRRRRKRIQVPHEWKNFVSFHDIWEALDCDTIVHVRYPRPIIDLETWMLLRKAYEYVVGEDKSTIAPLSSTENGFSVNNIEYMAKQTTDGKGRGVFSNQFIRNGTLVWSTLQSAQFDNGHSYLEFLSILPTDLACDAIQWSYVQAIPDDDGDHADYHYDKGGGGEHIKNKLIIRVDLDEGALMNSPPEYDPDMANIGCIPSVEAAKVKGGCQDNNFAIRDIQPGEEMLCYYKLDKKMAEAKNGGGGGADKSATNY